MNLLKFLLLILLISACSEHESNNSQTKSKSETSDLIWKFKEGDREIEVHVDSSNCGITDVKECISITKIEVFSNKQKKIKQSIKLNPKSFPSYLESNFLVSFEDVNFDGYKDLCILNWLSIEHQTTYNYWFFDSTKGKYVRNKMYDEIRNPFFDTKNKTIHSWWRVGLNEFGHALYQLKDGKLELIVEQIEYWGPDNSQDGFLVTRKTIDGEIKETEQRIKVHSIDFMHDDCKLLSVKSI